MNIDVQEDEVCRCDPSKVCCQNCRFYEERTNFCRRNPPKPFLVNQGKNPYWIGMFPKIGMPFLDYCFEFQNVHED